MGSHKKEICVIHLVALPGCRGSGQNWGDVGDGSPSGSSGGSLMGVWRRSPQKPKITTLMLHVVSRSIAH